MLRGIEKFPQYNKSLLKEYTKNNNGRYRIYGRGIRPPYYLVKKFFQKNDEIRKDRNLQNHYKDFFKMANVTVVKNEICCY